MRFCCNTCPKTPTCADLADVVFATPEDFTDFLAGPDLPAFTPQRPICGRCFLELPVSGICGSC